MIIVVTNGKYQTMSNPNGTSPILINNNELFGCNTNMKICDAFM